MDDGTLDEVVAEFLIESYERLDQLDQDLVALEERPSKEVIGSVFRALHSVKGMCGFLEFGHLETVAHAAETLLVALRGDRVEATEEVITALLHAVDAIRQMLLLVDSTGSDGDDTYEALTDRLARLADAERNVAPRPKLGEILVARTSVTHADIEVAVSEQALGDARPLGEILISRGVVTAEEIEAALSAQAAHRGVGQQHATTRVDVTVLDDLVALVAELADVHDDVQTAVERGVVPDHNVIERLGQISQSLQVGVTTARMQPIGIAWRRFPRMVRDLAHARDKLVRLEVVGDDVTVDRTVVEAIKDPLTHLVRNAVDHGVEQRAHRTEIGKPVEAVLVLRAIRQSGSVVVELIDDGSGIDLHRVRDRAVEHQLIEPEAAAALDEAGLVDLIFLPGLSTAGQVTNVSGRGIGMDVVRTNVERIGGTIEVDTGPGRGTTMRLTLPCGPVSTGGSSEGERRDGRRARPSPRPGVN
jgi:two-component system, chemotaxis family, sensor kinase CheA